MEATATTTPPDAITDTDMRKLVQGLMESCDWRPSKPGDMFLLSEPGGPFITVSAREWEKLLQLQRNEIDVDVLDPRQYHLWKDR